jgi:hypothetical protein
LKTGKDRQATSTKLINWIFSKTSKLSKILVIGENILENQQ